MTRLLFPVLILAVILRFAFLVQYPAGLNADEAALGYNAYSLLLTGRDEHGHLLPVNLESFGDFKPGLYSYLLVLWIRVLGLTELAVRLPSALFGVLAVILIYFLGRLIFGRRTPALLAAGLLAVSPWHLHFSRGGWEVNLATSLLLLGTVCYLRWRNTGRTWPLLLSVVTFILSMYAYQSTRVIAPLLGVGLAVMSAARHAARLRQTFFAATLAVVMLIPLVDSLVAGGAASRLSGVGLLADEGPVNRVRQMRGQHRDSRSLAAKILHNRPVIYTIRFLANYLDHFHGDFLFISGDVIPRNRVPETGLFYLTDFVFMALGLIYLVRNRSQHSGIIGLWLIVAPLASAMTFQTPHALRAFPLVVPLTLLAAAGFSSLRPVRAWLVIPLVLVYGFQISRYLHQYYIHYPREYPYAWEYGFRDLVAYVNSVGDSYSRIIVTDKYDQPYILFLFYSRYDPRQFQGRHELTVRDKFNFSTVREYDKYLFTSTPWEKVRDSHDALIVTAPEDIPEAGVNIVKTIYFPDGSPAFRVISN